MVAKMGIFKIYRHQEVQDGHYRGAVIVAPDSASVRELAAIEMNDGGPDWHDPAAAYVIELSDSWPGLVLADFYES